MKIKKLTDEHVRKILNNECEDIKVTPESTTTMDLVELQRLCKALSQNTSANRLDLEQCGALPGYLIVESGRPCVILMRAWSQSRACSVLIWDCGVEARLTRDCCSAGLEIVGDSRGQALWGDPCEGLPLRRAGANACFVP